MNRRWAFGLLILAVCAGSVLCACEPDCCPLPPSSQAAGGGSSPLEGPNCPCATAAESDQRPSIDQESCLFSDVILPPARRLEVPLVGPAEFEEFQSDHPPKLFVVNHQLLI
jgi:hypothetical protein